MYEPHAHARLNAILEELDPSPGDPARRRFQVRLGANFYAIHSLFSRLYGEHPAFADRLTRLVATLRDAAQARPAELAQRDDQRERDPHWFLSQRWVAMALYTDCFAGDLAGLSERLAYLQELGVNVLHLMPMMRCPAGASDGGYAVSDFRELDPRFGSLDDLHDLTGRLRQRDMLLVLDVVLNHTSDQHAWARLAREGDPHYRAYYHVFEDRQRPDLYEESMPEVFPDTAPGNFTWDAGLDAWVMTVFNRYQWDLDYRNPDVFIEMLDVVLHWANQGADVLRLDAVAFLWKQLGTACQNEREAHLILQLLKDCCQVVAPGVLFIAEAIVAPAEVAKYFGEDAVIAKECDAAYNATLMALLWDAMATRNARLLNQGIRSLPDKLDGATWLNYVRCHDDIGLGFDDEDVRRAGYDPAAHRRFLLDYYTGAYASSPARGRPFGRNDKTGDARISGSLASLVGLQAALESGDERAVDEAVELILLLHGVILSFGGIPLLYYGDELGTLNDESYVDDEAKAGDSRWMHRPRLDWSKAERRHSRGTVEQRLFDGLRRLIAVRKATPAFADLNNREVLEVSNEHLFVFLRRDPRLGGQAVLVAANMDAEPQRLELEELGRRGSFQHGQLLDLCTDQVPEVVDGGLLVPPRGLLWLGDHGRGAAPALG